MGEERKRPESERSPLHGYDAATLLAMSGDVSIYLSSDSESVVLDVMVTEKEKFDADLRAKWLGRRFEQIVAKDSLGKIEPLLTYDAGISSKDARWRHLNFLVEGAAEIPLLAKHFRVETPSGHVLLVVCRDLRPMTELNARWQNDYSRLFEQVAQATATNGTGTFADHLIGSAPLSDIMAAAVDEVAKLCIEEALKTCNGDEAAAAQLLCITTAELRRRRRTLAH